MYTISRDQPHRRQELKARLYGLNLLPSDLQELIVTAWATTWISSGQEVLDDLPYTAKLPKYPLIRHVNEVTRVGLELANFVEREWGEKLDPSILVPILILHDVDKPLLYRRNATGAEKTPLFDEVPHGVIGGMLLKELGFPQIVVSTVATHAVNSPFHGSTVYAYVLHYADMFAADRAFMTGGLRPIYQASLTL